MPFSRRSAGWSAWPYGIHYGNPWWPMPFWPPFAPYSEEQEIAFLEDQAAFLEDQLAQIQKRITALNRKKKEAK